MPEPGAQSARRPEGGTYLEFIVAKGSLLPAEEKLVEACAMGESAQIGAEPPDRMTDTNRIRSALLRFLILGGDDRVPIHEKGVSAEGAWIDGDLDLENCRSTRPLTLDNCYVDGAFLL